MAIPDLDAIEGSLLGSMLADRMLAGTSRVVGDARFGLHVSEVLAQSLDRLQERLSRALVRAHSSPPLGKRSYDRDALDGCELLREAAYGSSALAPRPHARGWGAASRASHVGLVCEENMVTDIAALSAALTHQHPAAIFSTCAWSALVAMAALGVGPHDWKCVMESLSEEMPMPPALEPIPRREGEAPSDWWEIGRREFQFSFSLISSQRWDQVSDPALGLALEKGTTAAEAVSLSTVLSADLVRYMEPHEVLSLLSSTETAAEMLTQMSASLLGASFGRTIWPRQEVRLLSDGLTARITSCVAALEARHLDQAYIAPVALRAPA